MENKRFYWIKLYTSFFSEDSVKFLMSQENGSQYITLYLMLCLMAANTKGRLCMNIGQMIVPYDIDKITLECKYFSRDTITVALGLYQQMGLIYVQEDGVLAISKFDELVGSETAKAKAMRDYRKKKVGDADGGLPPPIDADDNPPPLLPPAQKTDPPKKRSRKPFQKPTIEDAKAYCQGKGYNINVDKWYAYYEANGWKVGKNPMQDWKASIRYWNSNGQWNNSGNSSDGGNIFAQIWEENYGGGGNGEP